MTIQDISLESPNNIKKLYEIRRMIAKAMKKSYILEFTGKNFSSLGCISNELFVNEKRDSVIIKFHSSSFIENNLNDFLGEEYKEKLEKINKLRREIDVFWITNKKKKSIHNQINTIVKEIEVLVNERTNSFFKINEKYKINVIGGRFGICWFQFCFSELSIELSEGLSLWFSKTKFEPIV